MKNKKVEGCTLVEVIVVMLILAILSAMFIPKMIGYLDRASEKEALYECRSTVIASQTILNQTYAYKETTFEGIYKNPIYNINTSSYDTGKSGVVNLKDYNGMTEELNGVICGLAEASGTITNIQTDSNCRLINLMYISSDGKTVMYDYDADTGYVVMNE